MKKMGNIKWIGTFVCAMMLVGMIVPTGGQVETRSEGIEIEVLVAEGDYGVVRVGDYIIEGTPDHVEIRTEGRGIVSAYDYRYTPVGEGYEVTVYDSRSGQELITTRPNSQYRASEGAARGAEKIIFDFDGIPYVSGKSFGIPYSHVDYESVWVEPRAGALLTGRQAYHNHIPQEIALGLTNLPPSVLGLVIGGILGAPTGFGIIIGGAIGAVVGYVGGAALRTLLLDETNSFWIVSGINSAAAQGLSNPDWYWTAVIFPLAPLLKVPNYMRVGSLLLWDTARLGDPEEY